MKKSGSVPSINHVLASQRAIDTVNFRILESERRSEVGLPPEMLTQAEDQHDKLNANILATDQPGIQEEGAAEHSHRVSAVNKSFREDSMSYHPDPGPESNMSRRSPRSLRTYASPKNNNSKMTILKTPMLLKGMDLSVKKTFQG